MPPPIRHDPYASLRIGNFRWFISSLLAMTVATQIQAVVVAWQIYELTHDPLSLGLIGLAEAVPFIGLVLFAGHVADRASRLRISLMSLAALLLCSLALLSFTLRPGTIAVGRVWPMISQQRSNSGFSSPTVVAFEFLTPSAMPMAAATPIAGAPRTTMLRITSAT